MAKMWQGSDYQMVKEWKGGRNMDTNVKHVPINGADAFHMFHKVYVKVWQNDRFVWRSSLCEQHCSIAFCRAFGEINKKGRISWCDLVHEMCALPKIMVDTVVLYKSTS